jgi:GNAT superfamily N-acetyltransferase
MIVLHPMSETDFAGFLAYFIPDYAEEIAANYHLSQEEAVAQAKREIAASLPDGEKTQGQSLKSIVHTDNGGEQQIGYLWYRANTEDQSAFIYDFYLLPAFRSQGLGSRAMQSLEALLRRRYPANQITRRCRKCTCQKVYEANGYQVTGYNMNKLL